MDNNDNMKETVIRIGKLNVVTIITCIVLIGGWIVVYGNIPKRVDILENQMKELQKCSNETAVLLSGINSTLNSIKFKVDILIEQQLQIATKEKAIK